MSRQRRPLTLSHTLSGRPKLIALRHWNETCEHPEQGSKELLGIRNMFERTPPCGTVQDSVFKGKYDCSIGFLAYAFVCSSTTPKEHHGPSHDRHQPQLPSPGRMQVMFLAWPWNINQKIFVFLVDKMDHYPSIHTESNPIQTNWV